ncbi:DUF58 domain-containing protein [Parafilimonas terrae]|uniref:DUF58 domain-containing protein n=1 Tax=Parafilimonas terrae TaxID=1465490 RepID=A0A1I5YMF1_9BACT|nr:DUF58 domain-containing protein [Parafilimonas terrae]SFQ45320.1 Protein of unknown function DUF58 [Parafilimonas terrae]
MEVSELLKKVRTLEIKSRRLTNHLFTGEYHTAFRGQGMAFKEVREYQPGDDVRFIDWNVSARMDRTYSKIFEEERELSVFLLIDVSASSLFGTFKQSKKELITEMAAVLAFSAISNNDKAGLIFFSNKVEKYIPAKKGKEHVLYMLREMITFQPRSSQTDITKAIAYLNRVTRHKSIVFILSDFADAGYEQTLKVAAKRHDIIGIQVHDKRDIDLPKMGLLQLQDAETGRSILLNTSDVVMRAEYNRQFNKIQEDARHIFRLAGADLVQLATGDDYVKALQQFFMKRA